ncbi:MAG TPA: multidrug effflux MFS transporter [Alphaproteobacteria bacterium]|nr:multidrug effflux MFS transporter [Alphaproteobacteria bacterium]
MFRPNSLTLILLVGGLAASGPLSTDMYVPAMPSLTDDLGTSVGMVTLTLSLYLWAFALGQLVFGPVSDRFGRRPALLGGLTLYTAASVACALAPNIETLIAARSVQALGACSGQVLSRAIIRDLHEGTTGTRVLAHTTVIMGLSSMFAPVGGGYLTVWADWRAVFWALTGYGVIFGLVVAFGFKESLARPDVNAIQPLRMLRSFAYLIRNRTFSGYTFSLCFLFAMLYTFISSGPFVFIGIYGLAPQEFGLIFTAIASTFIVASLITGRISHRVGPRRIYGTAILATAAGGVALALAASGPYAGVVTIVAPMMVISCSMGFLMPVAFATAMAPHPRMAGMASALIGALISGFGAAGGALAGWAFDGSAMPMGLLIGLYCVLAMATFFLVTPRSPAPGTG